MGKSLPLDASPLLKRQRLVTVGLKAEKRFDLIEDTAETCGSGEGFEPTYSPVALLHAPMILLFPTAPVAKQAAELSRFSGGRFQLGVSISWNPAAYEALGQDLRIIEARQALAAAGH